VVLLHGYPGDETTGEDKDDKVLPLVDGCTLGWRGRNSLDRAFQGSFLQDSNAADHG
jgi:hypothetical protein